MYFSVASVYVLNVPYHIDKPFDYFIPEELRDKVVVGSTVTVPFGGGNKHVAALVAAISFLEEVDAFKPIISVSANVVLTDEDLKLCYFIKEHCFCTIGDAYRAIVPSVVANKVTELYRVTDKPVEHASLASNPLVIYNYIKENATVSLSALINQYTDEVIPAVKALIKLGYVEVTSEISLPTNIKLAEYISSPYDITSLEILKKEKKLRTPRQEEIFIYVASKGTVDVTSLRSDTGATSAQIHTLISKGVLKSQKVSVYRDPYETDEKSSRPDNTLSCEQQRAYDILSSYMTGEKAEAALLHGITGSGKTRVIISLIDKAIEDGKQVIMLVPEIALTPQTVGVFRAFYGGRCVVWHSSLSVGEKYDAWRKIKNGDADICIGTRSAIFAPFSNLGLIVIDEEHEHTYKSEQSPRYNTHDIARFRAAYNNALLLLASATPSLESYYKAEKGIYHLVKLGERYGNASLPETVIYDLRADSVAGNIDPLGSMLSNEISENLKNGNQTILFMNRRGYHNFLICVMCGAVIKCPHCSVAMTVHNPVRKQVGRDASRSHTLMCHYCGYTIPMPEVCPECAFEGFRPMGYGTQRVEESIAESFPDAKVIRMDADTTSSKFSYDKILTAFRERKADILLGTQMVTKGHDFPDVTLVGVVLADTMIHIDDYAANERAFSLLTQVIGRAGRSNKSGKAIIQTYSADNRTLFYAAAQDYDAFYKDEIAQRKAYVFPPFCDIALVVMSSSDEALVQSTAVEYSKRIHELLSGEYSDTKAIVFGPFEASVYKINEIYRMRFIIKCRSNKRTRALLSTLMSEFSKKKGKKITIITDINPNNI